MHSFSVGTGRPTPPRVTIEPHYQEVKVGDPIEFRCIAEGFPEPVLRWTGGRNNQLNPQATFIGGFFRIPAARKSDESEYFCSATNSAGSESRRTILLVTGGIVIVLLPFGILFNIKFLDAFEVAL